MTADSHAITSGRRLARNTIWNLVGMVLPLLVGVFAMPSLIEGLGKERFGLLAIIWMGVGYFSLFDMGLGRALTKLIAERLGGKDEESLGGLIWTALFLVAALGVLGASIVFIGADLLIRQVFNIDPVLQEEAITAFRVLAVGIPVVVVTSSLIGVLEAHQRFGSIALVRVPLGVLTFLAPLIVLQFTPSLVWSTAALLLARVGAAVSYFLLAMSIRRELTRPRWWSRKHMGALFRFGGWLTVTNLVGPMMVYFDRFLIGAILTMTAVTYYVTPYEVLSRTLILPQALMGVMFPAMAYVLANERGRISTLYGQVVNVVLFSMLPVTLGIFLFSPELLDVWLGPEFGDQSTLVAQWLAFGCLINALARPSFTLLQSAGHPDLVAKAHLAELLPYMVLLWGLTMEYGISGAAAAWALRVLVDAIILNEIVRIKVLEVGRQSSRLYVVILVVFGLFLVSSYLEYFFWRVVLFFLVICFSAYRVWPVLSNALLSKRSEAHLA